MSDSFLLLDKIVIISPTDMKSINHSIYEPFYSTTIMLMTMTNSSNYASVDATIHTHLDSDSSLVLTLTQVTAVNSTLVS
jgi:hypothetical protein